MTKRVVFCLALAAMLMCTMAAFAQGGQGGGQGGGRPMMSPDDRVAQLDKELTLTADQKTKLKALFEDLQKDQEKMRGEMANMSQEDRRAKMTEMRKAQDDKIKKILTEEQGKKYDEWQEKMRAQRGQGGPPKQ